MREYGLGYFDTLKLPLKVFWTLNRQVSRLRAEEDQRRLGILTAAQSSDAAKEAHRALSQELGSPTVIEKGFDEAQFLRLQQKFGQSAS